MSKVALPQSTKDFKKAKYNPRTITDKRLQALQSSMGLDNKDGFGDLSGVVFNVRTKTLVSGHQRMTSIEASKAKTKIIQKSYTDEFGTVAVGFVEATSKAGTIRVPYRAVDWTLQKEKAANVAANAHGGQFDKEKLALVLADIEKTKAFDVELVGLDPLTLKSLKLQLKASENDEEDEGTSGGFQEYGEDIETTQCCPKCQYKW